MDSITKRLDSLKAEVRPKVLPLAKKHLEKAVVDLADDLLAAGRKKAL